MAKKLIQIADNVSVDRQKAINKILNKWRKRQIPPRKFEELEERANEFFQTCEELEMIPDERMLRLCLGISQRSTWTRWKAGLYRKEWQDFVLAGCATCEAAQAEAALSGEVNTVYAIWEMKSIYGYSDLHGQSEAERTEKLARDRDRHITDEEWQRLVEKYDVPLIESNEHPEPEWLKENDHDPYSIPLLP